LKLSEKELMQAFADFCIQETKFPLKYATFKPNKWKNYALYSLFQHGLARYQASEMCQEVSLARQKHMIIINR